jgi:glycosyltransferase involved in cell wall biosynthesis
MKASNHVRRKVKILFFIESIGSGGKQRRFIELISYLKNKNEYEINVIFLKDELHYDQFLQFNIPYIILKRKLFKKDPRIFFLLYRICADFKPDIIHTWGNMSTFYSIPAMRRFRIPLVNSQITNAYGRRRLFTFYGLTTFINLRYSTIVTANSRAGLESYGLAENKKYRVIYNGINPQRFVNIPSSENTRREYNFNTKYAVIMAASFSDKKDFGRFLEISKIVSEFRSDITFYAAGDGPKLDEITSRAVQEGIRNIRFPGNVKNIEALVSVCDLGVLFTNKLAHAEGVSNSILEYMALGKPVIANDAGGTREVVKHKANGYLIDSESPEEIAKMVIELILDRNKRYEMGLAGRRLVAEKFTLDNMGKIYEEVYSELVG